jgi:hypothetical protein
MATNDPSPNERNVTAVVRKAEESLGKILEASGTILYSSCETLTRGKFYFLGLNPGGSGENTNTIQMSLEKLATSPGNAYLDEEWGSASRKFAKGAHPLQQNYRFLFKELLRIQEDPIEVCASNLIFRRSISERGAKCEELVDKCWLVHEAILEIVRPNAIITFGRQPFAFIKKKLHGNDWPAQNSGHGKWTWQYSILESGEKLIGLPHLSRYALRNHPDVVNEIRERIG